jgi:hypothetical protein
VGLTVVASEIAGDIEMRGLCDTCDQVSELFQLAGRNDRNCSECHATIGTAIQLYRNFQQVERAGGDTGDLVASLKHIVRRLFDRSQLAMPVVNANAYLQ